VLIMFLFFTDFCLPLWRINVYIYHKSVSEFDVCNEKNASPFVVRPSDPMTLPEDLSSLAEPYNFLNFAGAYFHYASFVAFCHRF